MFGQRDIFGELCLVFDQDSGPVAEGDQLVLDHRLDFRDNRSQCHICFTDKTGQAWFSKTTDGDCQEQNLKPLTLPIMWPIQSSIKTNVLSHR